MIKAILWFLLAFAAALAFWHKVNLHDLFGQVIAFVISAIACHQGVNAWDSRGRK